MVMEGNFRFGTSGFEKIIRFLLFGIANYNQSHLFQMVENRQQLHYNPFLNFFSLPQQSNQVFIISFYFLFPFQNHVDNFKIL